MEDPTSIDDRSQYVISFRPRVKLSYPLCYGTLYIDKERLSFTRAEFNLSMDDKNKATQAILRKKPFGTAFQTGRSIIPGIIQKPGRDHLLELYPEQYPL